MVSAYQSPGEESHHASRAASVASSSFAPSAPSGKSSSGNRYILPYSQPSHRSRETPFAERSPNDTQMRQTKSIFDASPLPRGRSDTMSQWDPKLDAKPARPPLAYRALSPKTADIRGGRHSSGVDTQSTPCARLVVCEKRNWVRTSLRLRRRKKGPAPRA